MKAKKALKRLARVEALLSDVMDRYASSEQDLKDLLGEAKASVARAKQTLNVKASSTAAKKPPAKAEKSKKSGLSAEGRKRLSVAAKKRWAIAKKRGVSAVTGRPLAKTA